jgi:hypothetical protein
MAATRSGEEDGRIDTWRYRVKCVQHDLPQRDRSHRTVRLAALFQRASGEPPADVQDVLLAVNVASFQSEQFLGPQAAADSDERDCPVTLVALVGDNLHVLPGLERMNLAPFVTLPLRILDPVRRVHGGELPLDRPGECLTEPPEHVMTTTGWQLLAPILELDFVK